jgi:ribosomal protein S18 acetylase RimI-like enzyme
MVPAFVVSRWPDARSDVGVFMQVRLAKVEEIHALQVVETDAAALFKTEPAFAFVLQYPAREVGEYEAIVRAGGGIVADAGPEIAGFILMGVVGNGGHIWELSVRMKYQRQGIGRQLIDAGCQWAKHRGFENVTLTTFRQASWNAPAYAKLGFEIVRPDHANPELSRILEHERSIGLFRAERVAMRKSV